MNWFREIANDLTGEKEEEKEEKRAPPSRLASAKPTPSSTPSKKGINIYISTNININ